MTSLMEGGLVIPMEPHNRVTSVMGQKVPDHNNGVAVLTGYFFTKVFCFIPRWSVQEVYIMDIFLYLFDYFKKFRNTYFHTNKLL